MAYFFSVEINACPARVINNFFGGLLHDLPEVLTRDIVSPVKRAVKGLDLLIKDIESRQVEEQILPLIPETLHSQIRYFTENEFQSKIILDEKIEIVSTDVINQQYNEANYDPLDGEILRACDHLAAYLEAAISLKHGIRSNHIENAFEALLEDNRGAVVGGIDFGAIYTLFEDSLEK